MGGTVGELHTSSGDRGSTSLYRRLPRGPSDIAREAIVRNQRARLYGGMLNAVVQRGYDATTVGDVIALAGVSRKTFYEHFKDKHDCLHGTHQALLAHTRSRVIEAWRAEKGWANQLHAACGALFDEVRRHPKGTRMVLVDTLAAPGARERAILTSLPFERLVYVTLRASTKGTSMRLTTPCAIVGGIRQLILTRVLHHRQSELDTLAADVLDWLGCYRLPQERATSVTARPVPEMRRLPRFLEHDDPPARILGATFRLICDLGYARVTDAQLARRARLPTQALHRWFPNKQACLRSLVDAFMQEALLVARAQMHDGAEWPTEAYRAICAYTDLLTSNEALTRLAFTELFEVGPTILEHITKPVEALVAMLIELGPTIEQARAIAPEAIAGAIWSTLFRHVVSAATSSPAGLADQLAFIVLAPVVGAQRAEHELRVARHVSPQEGTDRCRR